MCNLHRYLLFLDFYFIKFSFQIRKKRQQGGKYNPKDCENKAGVMQHQFDHPSMSPPSPERLI